MTSGLCCPDAVFGSADAFVGCVQFTRLNAVYKERQRQLKMGIDVLKEDEPDKK